MKKIRSEILFKFLFIIVALCFMGHEVAPHHHHDVLQVHKNSCNSHDHNEQKASCNILNHIAPAKQSISSRIKFEVLKRIIPIDLKTLAPHHIFTNNFFSQIIQVFEKKQFKDDDQYIYASLGLRGPPSV